MFFERIEHRHRNFASRCPCVLIGAERLKMRL
jgi:hypothetical protein